VAFAIIRLRSGIGVREEIRRTMRMLRLTRTNHCSVIPETKEYKGMLQKAKDYITWGEIDADTLAELIRQRGRLTGDDPITDEYIAEKTEYDSIKSFSSAIVEGETQYRMLDGVKPLFRLHPARGGLEGIKRHHTIGGSLGYRGSEINSIVRRML